ncbi:MAG TPA: hypothetical protein DCZ92_14135 [Elusimicrobia bacterium]|nr:MAG: hypothetical protein A2016_00685 [Elusimicrobia bacterium GWF2_62_30]HBA61921.1 hypothetical protein [Elusimicrobiota bacterium]
MTKRKGQTLIEVVVATMIAAISATAVFSVVLTTTISTARSDKREAAALMLKRAQETLKNYVSAVPTESAYVPNAGKWSADSSGVWALEPGTHDISSLMNCPYLVGNPANPVINPKCDACSQSSSVCSFTYTVTTLPCGFNAAGMDVTRTQCKQVDFSLKYPDAN